MSHKLFLGPVSRTKDCMPMALAERDGCNVDNVETNSRARNAPVSSSSSTSSTCDGISSPESSREPESKRRVLEGVLKGDSTWAAPDLRSEFLQLNKEKEATTCKEESLEEEGTTTDLPDSTMQVSPDEYLLLLTKAQLGVALEAKAALSLDSFFSAVTEEQMAAYTMEVVNSVRNNDLDLLKKLHLEGQALDCFNRFGESLLNMACRRGFESIVLYLLESNLVDVRICDDGGRTPLHDACWNPSPQLKICQGLIEREPALLLVADRRGCTAFQYARQEHWDQWRKFLFENRKCLWKLKDPDMLRKFAKC